MPTPVHLRPKQPMTGVGGHGTFAFDTSSGHLRHEFVKHIKKNGYAVTVRPGEPLFRDPFNPAFECEDRHEQEATEAPEPSGSGDDPDLPVAAGPEQEAPSEPSGV